MTDVAQLEQELPTASIAELAAVIAEDWRTMSPHAAPYCEAMFHLTDLNSKYGWEDGAGIVRYFLSNAGTWKGEVARAVKAELRRRLEVHGG